MGDLAKEVFTIRHKYRDLHQSKVQIKQDHIALAEDKPQLFDMITSNICDDTVLNQMMAAYNGVNTGKVSQHDASVAVGESLVNTYVKPSLPKTEKKD